MRQPTPTLPITAKMLRHFAVVTMAVTACIGVLAQGENAEVASQPKHGSAQQPDGSLPDFGGGERTALTGGNKGPREVNGMKLASGTRLQSNNDTDIHEPVSQTGDGVGYVQISQPAMSPGSGAFAPGSPTAAGLAPQVAPPPIPKDANGVPAPGAAVSAQNPATRGKLQPPRKATQQEIEQMMADSSLRSGRVTTD